MSSFGRCLVFCHFWGALLFACGFAANAAQVIIEQMLQLPELSLNTLRHEGVPPFDLEQARRAGLQRTNLPSLGSGLEVSAAGEWFGLTDRGPNLEIRGTDGRQRRVLPLPRFAPGIAQLRTNGNAIELVRYIQLRDSTGKPLSGLGNASDDEPAYISAEAPEPLPPDPCGVDPEGLRCMPDGDFLVSEEYAPSLLRADRNGRVLWRLIPKGHELPGASYPVRAILPAAVRARRHNRGFETLALSADGRFAYLALQSPAVAEDHPQARLSRIVRVIEVDVSNRTEPIVISHFLARMGTLTEHPSTKSHAALKWNDAVWLSPRRLLILEQGRSTAVLRELDLNPATNLLGHQRENNLRLDAADPTALEGLTVAESRLLVRLDEVSKQGGHKLEGLSALGNRRYAVANDNDFGIGENTLQIPTRVWIVRPP